MAKGELCRVSNCKNKITYKGTVCGTHKWRWAKFRSYDLPGHAGEPSSYINKPKLPEGIVKICSHHGELTLDDVYPKYYKGMISSYDCKKCTRDRYVVRRYEGINGEECYQEIFAKQNGVCAICFKSESMLSNNKTTIKKLSIDHCHITNKVRGLLCCACNTGIGYLQESEEIIESALNYIKKHRLK